MDSSQSTTHSTQLTASIQLPFPTNFKISLALDLISLKIIWPCLFCLVTRTGVPGRPGKLFHSDTDAAAGVAAGSAAEAAAGAAGCAAAAFAAASAVCILYAITVGHFALPHKYTMK